MRTRFIIVILSIVTVSYSSCKTSYHAQSLQYKDYRITADQVKDASMVSVLQPYSDSVNKSMNDVIGIAEKSLDKKSPEGALGNFMVDAFLTMARQKFNTSADVAFMNYGGIRLTQLPAGPVTRGKIFELMPFDNLVILQKMDGATLQRLLDLAAARGGWPVAGMTMEIKDKKAVNIKIAGKPLDPTAMYTTVNSDYVANGGDDATFLKAIPQINRGYLMRDALIDYSYWLKSQGKNISANEEKRVINVQ